MCICSRICTTISASMLTIAIAWRYDSTYKIFERFIFSNCSATTMYLRGIHAFLKEVGRFSLYFSIILPRYDILNTKLYQRLILALLRHDWERMGIKRYTYSINRPHTFYYSQQVTLITFMLNTGDHSYQLQGVRYLDEILMNVLSYEMQFSALLGK